MDQYAITPTPTPSDVREYPFDFTRRWFLRSGLTAFSTYLTPRFDGSFPINILQIGVFEGMDLVWQFQHTLQHPDSRAVGIDPWSQTRKLFQSDMDAIHQRALHNLHPWRGQLRLIRGTSQSILSEWGTTPVEIHGCRIHPGEWDLIVIDGDHSAPAVFQDATLALPLLRPGGWLLFDDVRPNRRRQVADGLHQFLNLHAPKVHLAWSHHRFHCYEKLTSPCALPL